MGDFTVRIGGMSDFPALAAFYDEVVAANAGTPFDVHWNRKVHPSDKEITDALQTGSMYMMEREGELLGAAIVNDIFATGYEKVPWVFTAQPGKVLCIHLFATKPGMHGRGLGRRLMDAVVEDTRKRGFELLRLDAFQHNLPARTLYEKVGFQYRGVGDLTYEEEDLPPGLPIVMYEMQL